ncbi:TetR family transcriptional regulator [Streptomyces sp. HPF1205]|uniref:TetR/AcrR family transcriptional regulator n=1 Tax=Streptomyces sp. HPF1205 TaxID=2873262 RepID=UPI001CED0873|nr:TetR family transcriptional regulator [Streptomyces sp. HPF1205]
MSTEPAGAAPGAGSGRPRRRGRPAGPASGETRDRILTVAREEFSARGYDRTSVRSIGKAAGVDPALVHHYFGTKEQVFAAAIEVGLAPAAGVSEVVAGPGGELGERVARFFLQVWEDPVTRDPLLAVVRSALTNDTAAAVFRTLVSRMVLARVAGELAVPDAEFRVQLAASHLVGVVMLRYLVKVEPMASARPEELVRLVAPALQRYLTAPDVHP